VIAKVRRAAVVDGDEVEAGGAGGDDAEAAFSMESFLEALREEAATSAAYYGDAGLVMEEAPAEEGGAVDWTARPAADVLTELRKPGSELNWATFTIAQ
jgi:hypothetical protein